MGSAHRVAVGSLFIECNNLVSRPADISYFERTELRRGDEVLRASGGAVGGILATLRERHCDLAPLTVASSVSAGPLLFECYLQLKTEILSRLQAALPVDGVILALHGSSTAINVDDPEGDLLGAVRQLVGPNIPVVATLDCHAHITSAMIRSADALVAWETYPHRDTYTTGVRGARILLNILDGNLKPVMVMAKVPVLAGGVNGHTEGPGPFADIMRYAKSLEGSGNVVSTSVLLVHPYLDLPDMGSGGLVITNGDASGALTLARDIAQRYWESRFDLEPEVYTPDEAIKLGMEIAGKPILLVETADCAGGGATGDSVATLNALLAAHLAEPSLVPVADPEAAALCHQAGEGKEITLTLGHKLDPQWGKPVTITGRILRLSDGRFRYTGGVWEGEEGNMGPSAVVQAGSVQVLISTYATYEWADEQFQSVGMDARQAKFIVAKNPMNHRLGYAGFYKERFILDTPGPTPATLKHIHYRRLQRPFFPFDRDIPGLNPVIMRHDS
jgi:microcystin degradation protein MlrC